MGQAIVKCARDRDLYLIWSSVVDNAIWAFESREVLLDFLDEEYDREAMISMPPMENSPGLRLARADRLGTSMIEPFEYGWDDEQLRVMEGAPPCPDGPDGAWYIRREHLVAYAEAILAAETPEAEAVAGHDLMRWEEWE